MSGPWEELEWWNNLSGQDAIDNTSGFPPYDVEQVAARIDKALGPTERILDLGCGMGTLTNWMAHRRPRRTVIGIDIAPGLLRSAMMDSPENAKYWRCDGRNIPKAIGPHFDGAYSVTVFQHIPYEAAQNYVAQVHERLIDGATFAFTVAVGDEPIQFLNHQMTDVQFKMFGDWVWELFGSVECDDEPDDNGWTWVTATKEPS